jgi:hypothetical protein
LNIQMHTPMHAVSHRINIIRLHMRPYFKTMQITMLDHYFQMDYLKKNEDGKAQRKLVVVAQ